MLIDRKLIIHIHHLCQKVTSSVEDAKRNPFIEFSFKRVCVAIVSRFCVWSEFSSTKKEINVASTCKVIV